MYFEGRMREMKESRKDRPDGWGGGRRGGENDLTRRETRDAWWGFTDSSPIEILGMDLEVLDVF
jgi:hypothetical protein